MQKLFTTKNCCLSILYIILILINSDVIAAAQKIVNWLDEPINISFQNDPLSMVLKKISEQAGVSIAYDQKLANEKVTGNYQNVKTSDAITRLFKGRSISIQVNNKENTIIILTFGAKNFIWAGSNQQNGTKEMESSSMTLADIEKMHAHQYKTYKKQMDDNSEILSSGMTRGEVHVMHNQQYENLQKNMATDNKVLTGGMTQDEIKTLHKQQHNEYIDDIANDKAILTGNMTRGEIRVLHKNQYKEFQTSQNNSNHLISSSMTQDEIRSLHEKQYEEYQQTIHKFNRRSKNEN